MLPFSIDSNNEPAKRISLPDELRVVEEAGGADEEVDYADDAVADDSDEGSEEASASTESIGKDKMIKKVGSVSAAPKKRSAAAGAGRGAGAAKRGRGRIATKAAVVSRK